MPFYILLQILLVIYMYCPSLSLPPSSGVLLHIYLVIQLIAAALVCAVSLIMPNLVLYVVLL